MSHLKDNLLLYSNDKKKYGNHCKNLFWWKKHKTIWRGQNFGDYLSFVIVGKILRRKNLVPKDERRLLAIGSILHFAKDGDVIWGSGVNGKINPEKHKFKELDIRMLRGPKTKAFLESRDIFIKTDCFGEPGLLLPTLFPEFKPEPVEGKITIIPNLNEIDVCKKHVPKNMNFVSPMTYWRKVILEILSSELVLTSSLHGIVVAEVFNIPVRFMKPIGGETLFKYQDYYLATGRELKETPSTVNDRITKESGISLPSPVFNSKKILNVFPYDLFKRGGD